MSPHPPTPAASAASEQKNFDEESIASVSTSAHNETRDGFCPDDLAETSALQALQERTYGFSFWPKVGVVLRLGFVVLGCQVWPFPVLSFGRGEMCPVFVGSLVCSNDLSSSFCSCRFLVS